MALELTSTGNAKVSRAAPGGESLWSRLSKIEITATRITPQDRMLFTERIELLLETGVSLLEALQVLHQQSTQPRVRAVLESLVTTVGEGQPLSVALSRHPEMFPQTYVRLVAAAEEGSFLPQVLRQLRDMEEKSIQMRSAVMGALTYPAFLILFSLAVVLFVLVVIFPKFEDLFMSIRGQLPAPTLVLMFLSGMLRQYWLLLSVVGSAAIAALAVWLKTPRGRQLLDQLKISAPLVGTIFVQVYVSHTFRVLGTSLANGVPVMVAMKAAQDIVANSVFTRFLQDVLASIEQGKGIAAGFGEAGFVPPMVRQMVATGEQSGNLAKVMNRVAEFYERELYKRIAAFAKAVEPIMLMAMGVIVGLIVAALILPIFKLSRAVH
jgi:type II secretory pathway component PulF